MKNNKEKEADKKISRISRFYVPKSILEMPAPEYDSQLQLSDILKFRMERMFKAYSHTGRPLIKKRI